MAKILIWVVVIAVVVGGGWYFLSRDTEAPRDGENAGVSIAELLSSSTAQKCTISQSAEGSSSEGTIYVAGGKVRGDFVSQSGGQTMTAHLLVDGTTSYSWVDGLGVGIKAPVRVDASTGEAVEGEVDINQKLDYQCEPWTSVDTSLFAVPATVQFTDLNSLSTGATAPGANLPAVEVEVEAQ